MNSILDYLTMLRPKSFDRRSKSFLKFDVEDSLIILVKHIFNVIIVKIGIIQNARKFRFQTSMVIRYLDVENATKTIYNLRI